MTKLLGPISKHNYIFVDFTSTHISTAVYCCLPLAGPALHWDSHRFTPEATPLTGTALLALPFPDQRAVFLHWDRGPIFMLRSHCWELRCVVFTDLTTRDIDFSFPRFSCCISLPSFGEKLVLQVWRQTVTVNWVLAGLFRVLVLLISHQDD